MENITLKVENTHKKDPNPKYIKENSVRKD